MTRAWSDDEEQILLTHWRTNTDRQLSYILGRVGFHRTEKAVHSYRDKLGLLRTGAALRNDRPVSEPLRDRPGKPWEALDPDRDRYFVRQVITEGVRLGLVGL